MLTTAISGEVLGAVGARVGTRVDVRATWDCEDPIRVTFVFIDERDTDPSPSQWVFSRQLLIEGLCSTGWVGDGDVRACALGPYFWLSLDSPDGHSFIRMPREQIDWLASESCREIPPNSDAELAAYTADMDEALQEWLA